MGGPGIGKTMISSFLIGELKDKFGSASNTILAYVFCDNKDEKRNTDIAILRGLLWQILRQKPLLFEHVQSQYEEQKGLTSNFEALWRVLLKILQDPNAGEIYILIDALDECEEKLRWKFNSALVDLLRSPRLQEMRFKIFITSRPENDIRESFFEVEKELQVDSSKINADLSKFIRFKVKDLFDKKMYPPRLQVEIESRLNQQAGGTFLWASLVLEELSKNKIHSKVLERLSDLPSDLNQLYDRILRLIEPDYQDIAKVLLRWLVVAKRPLTIDELAMVGALFTDKSDQDSLPTINELCLYKNSFQCCGSLVYLDPSNNTVNLVHQSVKDYLLGEYLQEHINLSAYSVTQGETHELIFGTCWRVLSSKDLEHGNKVVELNKHGRLNYGYHIMGELAGYPFLDYALRQWLGHLFEAYRSSTIDFKWSRLNLEKAANLRDWCSIEAAEHGHENLALDLVKEGARLEVRDYEGRTPLSWAAENGQAEVVKRFLDAGADVEARATWDFTPLLYAARYGYIDVIKVLLAARANVEARDCEDRTPLLWAARYGYVDVIKLLLAAHANVEAKEYEGGTPLLWAARYGNTEAVEELLNANADVEAGDCKGRTPLSWATDSGQTETLRVLLAARANIEAKDDTSQTALLWAARIGNPKVVKVLIAAHANIDAKDSESQTPISLAARYDHSGAVEELLDAGADVETRDSWDRTPLSWAAEGGWVSTIKVLLEAHANIDAKDKRGRKLIAYAVRNRYRDVAKEAAKVLLAAGAELELIDNEGNSLDLSWVHETMDTSSLARMSDWDKSRRQGMVYTQYIRALCHS